MKPRTEQNQTETNGSLGLAEDSIQRRAYEIFVSRGQTPGHEVEDWLQAERELKTSAKQKPRVTVG